MAILLIIYFDTVPSEWILRGDPHLWEEFLHLQQHLS